MTKWTRPLRLVAVLAMCCVTPSHAQSLTEKLAACARETNAAKRLDCYDQLAATAKKGQPSAQISNVVAPHQDDKAKEAEFGVRNGPLEEQHHAESTQELSAVVSHIEKRATGELVITLENGQTWAQLEHPAYFPLNVGDTVHISSAAMGSYFLTTPAKRGTRVTRIH